MSRGWTWRCMEQVGLKKLYIIIKINVLVDSVDSEQKFEELYFNAYPASTSVAMEEGL